ncbi:septin family p-loop gtpase [Moniliophthora roreri MCA 2997]|uniref:Septin family p-loop gtpase n=2 Tax=Moniliophthora roreri TaxID=221103 RepID=V2X3Z7_MONRO|nr:septin family p-loop gtpase [Moniliophthora roreri MCA 2997]KAI3607633.1 septin family p-loop gtpase [Moniliophthora roreri]
MFSLRRKNKRVAEEPKVRGSPSLPEVHKQGIPWPESLIDASSIRQDQDFQPNGSRFQGATKTSLQGPPDHPIPFHKPFRPSTSGSATGGPISSLYMSNHPPSAFDNWKTTTPPSTTRYSQRRARQPPTFNVMVVGGQGTGKTSLLRLILETADISPAATVDQKMAVDRFLRGLPKATGNINTACVEICESRFDRVLLTVVDTPGLDYNEGRELKLERQVNSVMKYIDSQYADTMSEESKVVRKSKGDQHIHLCIYLIDPSSIMTAAERRAKSSLPFKTRSETTISQTNPPDLIPDTSSGDDSDTEEAGPPITMSPAEIRVIRRLATRSNVLPVVAKSDSLTDEKLAAVKEAVRNSLSEADLDFGVFGPPSSQQKHSQKKTDGKAKFAESNGVQDDDSDADDAPEEEEERQSRPVIKLRPQRHPGRNLSRSRSRRDLTQAAEDDRRPLSPDLGDRESVANVRFSAHVVARPDLTTVMPFAVIAPESTGKARRRLMDTSSSPVAQSEDDHSSSPDGIPQTPASIHSDQHHFAYLNGPPEDLRGVFVRKYRWGKIDVLDPDHCDFAALRTAVLSSHLKVLKTHTKEVLYEKYRTEKLLARRATRQITDDERHRLLEDLGI